MFLVLSLFVVVLVAFVYVCGDAGRAEYKKRGEGVLGDVVAREVKDHAENSALPSNESQMRKSSELLVSLERKLIAKVFTKG